VGQTLFLAVTPKGKGTEEAKRKRKMENGKLGSAEKRRWVG